MNKKGDVGKIGLFDNSKNKLFLAFSSPHDILEIVHSLNSVLSVSFTLQPSLDFILSKTEYSVLLYKSAGNQFDEKLYLLNNKQEKGFLFPTEKKAQFILIISHLGIFDTDQLLNKISNSKIIQQTKTINLEEFLLKKNSVLHLILQNLD